MSKPPHERRLSSIGKVPVHSLLKKELVHDQHFRTHDEARAAIFEWIEVLVPTNQNRRLTRLRQPRSVRGDREGRMGSSWVSMIGVQVRAFNQRISQPNRVRTSLAIMSVRGIINVSTKLRQVQEQLWKAMGAQNEIQECRRGEI